MSSSGNRWWHKALLGNQLGVGLNNELDADDIGITWRHGGDCGGVFRDNSAAGTPFVFVETVGTTEPVGPIAIGSMAYLKVGTFGSSVYTANGKSPVALAAGGVGDIATPHVGQLCVSQTGVALKRCSATGMSPTWDNVADVNSGGVISEECSIAITLGQNDAAVASSTCKAVRYKRAGDTEYVVMADFSAQLTTNPAVATTFTFTIQDANFFPASAVVFPLHHNNTGTMAQTIKLITLSTAGVATVSNAIQYGGITGMAIYTVPVAPP